MCVLQVLVINTYGNLIFILTTYQVFPWLHLTISRQEQEPFGLFIHSFLNKLTYVPELWKNFFEFVVLG